MSREGGRCPGLQSSLLRQGFVEAPNACWGVPSYLRFLPVIKPFRGVLWSEEGRPRSSLGEEGS